MIGKINTFIRLIARVFKILGKKDTTELVFSFFLSTLNTFLELLSITTIIFLLLVISGENITESTISTFFNNILPEDSIILSAASLMVIVVLIKTFFQIAFNWYQETVSQNIQNI